MKGYLVSELFTNRKESIPLTFSEDCLYLNIYTPANLAKKNRLPVSGRSQRWRPFWCVCVGGGMRQLFQGPGLPLPCRQAACLQGTHVCHGSVSPSGRHGAPGGLRRDTSQSVSPHLPSLQ